MASQITASIVRIKTPGGAVVGAGFLVADKQVVTCAHVVAQALGVPYDSPQPPADKVYLDFPLLEGKKEDPPQRFTGRVVFWREVSVPPKPGSDIAVLELDDDPPSGSRTGCLMAEYDLYDHSFGAFGFPFGDDNGIWASGVIRGKLANGWVQIAGLSKAEYFVMRGFSGTPLWDTLINGIVGMVVATDFDPAISFTGIKPVINPGDPNIDSDNLHVNSGNQATDSVDPAIDYDNPAINSDDSAIGSDDPAIGSGDPVIDFDDNDDPHVAYIIPTTLLIKACPKLGEHAIRFCPYRSLDTFGEKNTPFFFGRKAYTDDLVENVQNKPLVAVIGPSGCGKSSVVFAGLIPALKSERIWHTACFRPGSDPFKEIAGALIPLLEPKMPRNKQLTCINELSDDLKQRKVSFQDIIGDVTRRYPQDRLLLVIDQFEELFTLCHSEEDRQHFLDEFLAVVKIASDQRKTNIRLVITLRADFLGRALSCQPFANALRECRASLPLGPMSQQELQETIEKPALKLEVTIDDGLIERILEAVMKSPGKLPLLEFALTQMWGRQEKGRLTHKAYDEIGGVEGALTGYAEQVYGSLSQEEQKRVQSLFIQLVRPGETSEGMDDTRRLATRSELGEKNWEVARHLANARLLVAAQNPSTRDETLVTAKSPSTRDETPVTAQDPSTKGETVEIVHEALISGWSRLHEWIEANRAFRVWQERLRVETGQWEKSGHDKGALLRGAPLREAEDWLLRRCDDLSEKERTFIQAGMALQRRNRWCLVLGVLIILIVSGLGVWQWKIRQRIALSSKLAAQAERLRKEEGKLLPCSVLLAAEAMNLYPSLEADQALRNGMALLPPPPVNIPHPKEVTAVAFSPDQKYLATAGDNTAWLWRQVRNQKNRAVEYKKISQMEHTWKVIAIAFSPDGKYLATASDDCIKLWEAESGRYVLYMDHEGKNINSFSFSPDAQYLATASDDHTVKIWRVAEQVVEGREGSKGKEVSNRKEVPDSKEVLTLAHEMRVTHVAFCKGISPDEGYLATAGDDQTVYLWKVLFDNGNDKEGSVSKVSIGKQVILGKHKKSITAIVFSQDGKYLASAGRDHTAQVWEVESGKIIASCLNHNDKTICLDHKDKIIAAVFSPDGRYLATAGDDQKVKVWTLSNGEEHDITPKGIVPGLCFICFSPDGKYLATAGKDGTARVWDVSGRQEVIRMAHKDRVNAVCFSPDGKYLATASSDRTAQVWEASSICKDTFMAYKCMVHENEVSKAVFSPDGRYLATACLDHTARVWKVADGQEVARVKHTSSMRAVAFSSDGRYLAVGSDDHTARVWEIHSGQEIAYLNHNTEVSAVAFSPDGRCLATASTDQTIRVWKIRSGRTIACINACINANTNGNIKGNIKGNINRGGCIRAIAFSQDGQYLITTGADHCIRLWDIVKKKEMNSVEYPAEKGPISLSPDGKYLAITGKDYTARVFEITGTDAAAGKIAIGEETTHLDLEDMMVGNKITVFAFSPDNKYLAIADVDNAGSNTIGGNITGGNITGDNTNGNNTVRIWELDNGSAVNHLSLAESIHSIAFSPDGNNLAAAGDDNTACIWNIDSGGKIDCLKSEKPMTMTAIVFSPDGQYLVTAGDDNTARIWEVSTGKEVACARHEAAVYCAVFSPDGKYLATAGEDNTTRIWKAASREEKEVACLKQKGGVYSIAFSPDGQYLAAASGDNTVLVCDAAAHKETACLNHKAGVYSVAFSPDGQYLATASGDNTIRIWRTTAKGIWRATTSQEVRSITSSPNPVREPNTSDKPEEVLYYVTFSPDGKYLAAAVSDNTVRIWKTKNGGEIACITPGSYIHALAFSPNSEYLVTANADHTARIWIATTGREVVRLIHSDEQVYAAAFSPNGKYVATASSDHTARIWLWQPQDMINEACARVGRNLTQEEWKQYVGDEPYHKTCADLPDKH